MLRLATILYRFIKTTFENDQLLKLLFVKNLSKLQDYQ